MKSIVEAEQILEREREFHNKRFSDNSGKRNEDKFYRALHNLNIDFDNQVLALAQGKDILDFGCGTGDRAIKLHSEASAKSMKGIDISEEAIKIANMGVPANDERIQFLVDNCEQSSLPSASFDLIYGNGIIHHLKTEKAVKELERLLRPNGTFIFYEPLGTNPLINLYRRFTPNSRSPDEHPLLSEDFKILHRHLQKVDLTYYGFLTIAALPFYKDPKTSFAYRLASRLDAALFRYIPPTRFFAWSVLITAKKQVGAAAS
jgi:SAM-dependent methyltransferase